MRFISTKKVIISEYIYIYINNLVRFALVQGFGCSVYNRSNELLPV